MLNQTAWSRKVSMSYLRTFLVSYKPYQVWSIRYDGRKHKFLRKKRVVNEGWDVGKPPTQSDHPADVMRQKLYKPPSHFVDALLSKLNPLEQYQKIQILADPRLLPTRKNNDQTNTACHIELSNA